MANVIVARGRIHYAKTFEPKSQIPKSQVPKPQVPKSQVPKSQVPKSQVLKCGTTHLSSLSLTLSSTREKG